MKREYKVKTFIGLVLMVISFAFSFGAPKLMILPQVSSMITGILVGGLILFAEGYALMNGSEKDAQSNAAD